MRAILRRSVQPGLNEVGRDSGGRAAPRPAIYWSDHRLGVLRQSRLDLLDRVEFFEAGTSVHEPGTARACRFLLVGRA
jgi:hypothetical protein